MYFFTKMFCRSLGLHIFLEFLSFTGVCSITIVLILRLFSLDNKENNNKENNHSDQRSNYYRHKDAVVNWRILDFGDLEILTLDNPIVILRFRMTQSSAYFVVS